MKKRFAVLIMAGVMAGCLKTRDEINAEQSHQEVEKHTVSQQQAHAHEAPVKEKAPPSGYRFEEIDEQLRGLSGRVDSLENANAQMMAAKQNDNSAAKDKAALDQRLVAYEEALKKIEAELAALSDQVAKLKAPPPPEPPAQAAGKSAVKKDMEAGDELFNAQKWKEAIVYYSKYRDQNPKGKRYAEATYKIGVSFQELGMKDEARSFLEEVVAKFPNSKEGKKAALRLKTAK
jgi:TolA-binding protein